MPVGGRDPGGAELAVFLVGLRVPGDLAIRPGWSGPGRAGRGNRAGGAEAWAGDGGTGRPRSGAAGTAPGGLTNLRSPDGRLMTGSLPGSP